MVSRIVSFVLFIFVFTNGWGQKLEFEAGFGSYKMGKAKQFFEAVHHDISSQAPLKFDILNNFPPFIYYRLNIVFDLTEKVSIGAGGSFYTTGSRLSYADYSGFYTFDMIANGYAIRGIFRYSLKDIHRIKFSFYSDMELMNSILKINEELKINQNMDDIISNNVYSINLNAEPGIMANFKIGKCDTGMNLGYAIGLNGPLHLKDDAESKLKLHNGENMKLDWTGIRIGLRLSYNLAQINKD